MKKSLLALLLVVACGKNAPQAEAEKYLVPIEKPQALNASIELKSDAREIIILAFPEESEVANYSYQFTDNKTLTELFKPLPYLEKYFSNITKDMTPAQKVQGIMERVIAVSDARDNARRMAWDLNNVKIPASITQDIKTIKEKLTHDFPCYYVTKRGHKDRNKCYLAPIEGVTDKNKKEWKFESCEHVIKSINSYLQTPGEENIVSSNLLTLEQLQISPEEMEKFNSCNQIQKEAKALIDLSNESKQEVVEFLGGAQGEGKDTLVFLAAAEIEDSITGDSTVIFDPKDQIFKKFSVTMNFYDDEGKVKYGPEYGNMSQPTVTEINGSGFYRVDFEIYTPNFTLKTLGLSLALDPILGLRISGKTKLEYKDGRTRAGIIRIDVAPIE